MTEGTSRLWLPVADWRTSEDMITDSIPWKEEPLRVANRLKKKKFQVRWTERSSFLVEGDIMVSAYSVRRLEARKLTTESDAHDWPRQHLYES